MPLRNFVCANCQQGFRFRTIAKHIDLSALKPDDCSSRLYCSEACVRAFSDRLGEAADRAEQAREA